MTSERIVTRTAAAAAPPSRFMSLLKRFAAAHASLYASGDAERSTAAKPVGSSDKNGKSSSSWNTGCFLNPASREAGVPAWLLDSLGTGRAMSARTFDERSCAIPLVSSHVK